VQILKETKGRVGGADGAAARMGLKRTTLILRLKRLGINPSTAQALADDFEEHDRIVQILKETKGRVGGADGAAARMGLKRTTLLTRMKKLGINPRNFL
jgi:transcriptional regulator with GAF, ATPase, and Fis domain